MAPVQFGTDGIRGRASVDITNDLAYRLGSAVASVFTGYVFVGYDTRESSPQLAAAVLAGLRNGGAIGVNLGYFTEGPRLRRRKTRLRDRARGLPRAQRRGVRTQ